MTDKKSRQPKGTPSGGEFAKNEHDEASGTMSDASSEAWFDYSDQEPSSYLNRERASASFRFSGRAVKPDEARALALHIAAESPDYPELRTFGRFGRFGHHGIVKGLDEIKKLRQDWRKGDTHPFARDIDALESFYLEHEAR